MKNERLEECKCMSAYIDTAKQKYSDAAAAIEMFTIIYINLSKTSPNYLTCK